MQLLNEEPEVYLTNFLKKAKEGMLKEWSKLDDHLFATKSKNLVVKDRRTKTIWTPMTDLITFKRRRYFDKKAKKYRYLLDEKLKIDKYKFISKRYQELALAHFPEFRSYEGIAKVIFNGRVSKMSIHNFIKNSKPKFKMKNYTCNNDGILWINADGLWVKKNKKQKAIEVKNIVIFSGRKKDKNSKRWKLIGRTIKHFINMSVKQMAEKLNEIILQYSQVREIRVIGDGARWIKNLCNEIGGIFYIDKFHYSKAITNLVGKYSWKKSVIYSLIDSEMSKEEFKSKLFKLVANKETGQVVNKDRKLITYLSNNLDYYIRNRKYDNPINSIEAIQAHYQAKFLKNRRKGWNIQVLNNLITYLNSSLNKGEEIEIENKNKINYPLFCNYGVTTSVPGMNSSGFVSHFQEDF